MASLSERLESKVNRSGEHHLWLGATKANGAGVLKVDGSLVTAQRVAWELVHGRLEPGRKVNPCPDEMACVRVDHLSLSGRPRRRKGRARKGGRNAARVRSGVYKLTVPADRRVPDRRSVLLDGWVLTAWLASQSIASTEDGTSATPMA